MYHTKLEIKTETGRPIVAPVSLSINNNEKIALIGEEGNGKTSFLNALMGHYPEGLRISKEVSNPNTIFGMIHQSLLVDDLKMSLSDYVLDGDWDNYGHFQKHFSELLPHLDLDDANRLLSSFSNGEQLRIQILRLLMKEVDIFLLDEPTNDLDMEALLWLEGWLINQEKPILMISHDLRMIENFANKIVHFEQLKRKTESVVTVYEGDYESYMVSRNLNISQANQTYKTQLKEKKKQEAKWKELYSKVSQTLQATKGNNPEKGRLLKKKMNTVKSMKVRMDKEDIGNLREVEKPIDIRSYAFDKKIHQKKIIDYHCDRLMIKDRLLASDIHLEVYSTDKIVILGRNGVGKSTMIKDLAKQNNLSVMHQDYRLNLDYSKSAVENLWQDGKKETLTNITSHLGSLNFRDFEMGLPVDQLSGGQRAKLSLLKCILEKPEILVLDEPTRNLSPLSVGVIYKLIQDFEGAVLAISHDRAFIDSCFTCIMVLEETGLYKLES